MRTEYVIILTALACAMLFGALMQIMIALDNWKSTKTYDELGARYNVPRWKGESNKDYSQRICNMIKVHSTGKKP